MIFKPFFYSGFGIVFFFTPPTFGDDPACRHQEFLEATHNQEQTANQPTSISENEFTNASLSANPRLMLPADFADVSSLPFKYLGNSFSKKFHRPSCPFAKAMNPQHVELFHFRCEAIKNNEVPCRYCLPHEWKTVSVHLIPTPKVIQPETPYQ